MLLRRVATPLGRGSGQCSAALWLLPLRHCGVLHHAPPSRAVTATRLPLRRCFAVHTQPPAPSSDDDSKKKATQHDDEENEKAKSKSSGVKANDDSGSNPWRHFQAFSGMDEYMDVTLIHYKNDNESKSDKKDNDGGSPHSHATSNAQKQTKD